MSNKIRGPLLEYRDEPKYIPVTLYFALQMAALFSGGIGCSKWFTQDENGNTQLDCPVCVNGQAAFARDEKDEIYVSKTLDRAGITTYFNDRLVRRINEHKAGAELYADPAFRARVTFEEYVTAGNIRFGTKKMWKNAIHAAMRAAGLNTKGVTIIVS